MPGTTLAGVNAALLDVREIVRRVAVQLDRADVDQRIVFLRPHLRDVERIEAIRPRLRASGIT